MPAESVTFTYNGTTTAVATVHNAQIGTTYRFTCDDGGSGSVADTAVASTLVLTVSDIAAITPGLSFYAQVEEDSTAYPTFGATVFKDGETPELVFPAVWTFDGDKTVTVTFDSTLGLDYQLATYDSASSDLAFDSGTGASLTLSVVGSATYADDYFWAVLTDATDGADLSVRLFTTGVAGAGFPGNPSASAAPTFDNVPVFSVAFDDTTLEPSPTWTQIG